MFSKFFKKALLVLPVSAAFIAVLVICIMPFFRDYSPRKEIPPDQYNAIIEAARSLEYKESFADRMYGKHNAHLLPEVIQLLDPLSVFADKNGIRVVLSSTYMGANGLFVPREDYEFTGAPNGGVSYEKLTDGLYRYDAID